MSIIAEDFDDIAQRLKELEREKAQRIERQPIAADEPVKMEGHLHGNASINALIAIGVKS